ncbi:hypothetical protein FB45DRAFT_1055212 [Roridomyces roridus]|uniref:Uncharacterized protein n=1 Tax=Roridomyces roridus TaxID=1738132 RepID=A0AAD7FV71_9AGAR|nr:hypothetical protein FB45DRAFT_1055212 [Roridomyces roridus]
MAPGFKVHNRSNQVIVCSITNKTGGNPADFEIKPFEDTAWVRNGWEDVVIKNKENTQQTALWINRGGPALVYFDGFDKPLTIYNDYRPDPGFEVNNLSPRNIMCFISANTMAASSAYVTVPPGQSKVWPRTGWEAVAFKSEDNKNRIGLFFDNKGARTTIDFHGFEEPLVIHEPPENFIADEHYAEAIRIADRSYASGNSRASSPGGLTASIYKVDKLEFLTTGKKTSLVDHNQIYTLALLINHLKYGLAEPGIVCSVTPDWVKVAVYTCEFDAIVVLGFPTKAIDLIAPDKKRPDVGTRVLVVSQFTYRRSPETEGVQADITMGPRSLDKWHNFQPLVAQFVTDDSYAPVWKEKMDQVDEDLWNDTWEGWVAWKARHGENFFRLGAPTKIAEIATTHVDNSLPAYVP